MKKNRDALRAKLRATMLQNMEQNLVSEEELERVSGGTRTAGSGKLTCKCWCCTGLLSTCAAGSIGNDDIDIGVEDVGIA